MPIAQSYRDAMLEYLALDLLEHELRDQEEKAAFRADVTARKTAAREKIESQLLGKKQPGKKKR